MAQKFNLKPLHQQVVVVFGASSGIGRATALEFLSKGATVIAVGRNEGAIESLLREAGAEGRITGMIADASNPAEVQAVADRAVKLHGRIDTWAHIAGLSVYAKFWDHTPEEFRGVIETNLLGAAYGAMAALPVLRANPNGGALIQVSSVVSRVPFPLQSAYVASKHGMKGYLDVLRMELEHDEIPVSLTNIMPAVINTPFFANAKTKLGVKPRAMGPIYQPEQVADAIVRAAHIPAADVVVGGAGHLMILTAKFMPWLLRKFSVKAAFDGQMTNIPKPEEAPSNLEDPQKREDRIHGNLRADKPKLGDAEKRAA